MSLKLIGWAFGVGMVSAGAGGAYMFERDEGVRRAFKMYGSFAPIIMSYRALEMKHSLLKPSSEEVAEEEWNKLHSKFADEVLDTIRSLKGFYVKYGQVLAGRPDLLPEIYVEKLRTLENAVPPMSKEQVHDVVKSSMKIKSISEIFSEFSDNPVGSASIGQVHKAKLRKAGETVAVKIQYPDAERLFRNDIKTARGFCRIFAPEQLVVFDEIEKQFMGEFDYRKEAAQMDVIRGNMKIFKKLIEIPKPIMSLTTKEILVMKFLEGKKLYDAVKEYGEQHAARQGKTFKDLEREMRQKIMDEGMPPKYSGPSASKIEMYRKTLILRNAFLNAPRYVLNGALHWIAPSKKLALYKTEIPLNVAFIMDTLMKVHGHQILVDGSFNGDPHAGNVLLLSDGRLGLIDYGQVKMLTEEERRHLNKVIVALVDKDKKKLKALAIQGGYRSKNFDEDVIYTMTRFALDTDGPEVCGNLNIQQFIDEQYRRDPWSSADPRIIMPIRTAFMLRGIGLMLNHPIAVTDYWGPIARKEIKK